MANNFYKKSKEKLQKEVCERYQSLSEEEKVKSGNMLLRDIEIFVKTEKKRSASMVVNDIRIS